MPSFPSERPLSSGKKTNLEALIDSQLNFKALASMSDLESAIGANSQQEDGDIDMEVDDDDFERQEKLNYPTEEVQTNPLADPVDNGLFKKDQFVLALFTDGAYPSQVVELVQNDKIKISCLRPLIIGGEKNFRFWTWPSSLEEETINVISVLPISPVLDIAEKYSAKKKRNQRNVVFELVNYDYVKKFD